MNRLFLHPPRALLPRMRCCCCYSTVAQQSQRTDRPLRLAVIGAGPAGFYTSHRVLSKLTNARVDMYESLPVPYGLVRFGVAPDHPEVKNCQDKFASVASSPRFTYIGNVPIGGGGGSGARGLPLSALTPHYDALLLSYGASLDRRLHIPGEDTLRNILSARAFVGWYNGLPEYAALSPDLSSPTAVIIGHGNVALDIARILLTAPAALKHTDIAAAALHTLSTSRIERVHVAGRRGPLQASFTARELRELLSIRGLSFSVPATLPDSAALPRQQKRLVQLLAGGAATPEREATKHWSLDFHRSPVAFFAGGGAAGRALGGVRFEATRLGGDGRAVGTGVTEDVAAGVAFRSIGYESAALVGFEEAGIRFDGVRGRVENVAGRVAGGVYTSGWVKRGPTGVIASTMYDAFETADAIVEDWVAGGGGQGADGEGARKKKRRRRFMNEGRETRGWEAVEGEARARGLRPVSWEEWMKIDAVEKERGKKVGKEREKFVSEEEMLAVLE